MRNILEGSFTEEGTGSGNDIFQEGFKFSASESRKKFDKIDSVDRGETEERLGSNWGVIGECAIEILLEIYEK